MKPSLLLRIAAALTFVHAVLHTVGGVFGEAPPGPGQTAVTAMKTNQFVAMGVVRTFWDYYMGFGLWVSLSLVVMAVVFWQLSSLDVARVRPIVMTFCVAFVASAVLSWRYFFWAPVVVELVIAICLLGAWVLAGRESASSRG